MQEIRNYCFKWSESGGLMSGIKPKKVYESVRFVDCTFHSNCRDKIKFIACEFHDCAPELLNCDENCTFILTAPGFATMEIVLALTEQNRQYFHSLPKDVIHNPYYDTV